MKLTVNMYEDELIANFLIDTISATGAVYEQNLHGHMLILIFSMIDSMGLLDAPESQIEATGDSFKNWVKKYLLNSNIHQFNEIDLWAARCAILHTFTPQSRLSQAGSARIIQYYSGPKDTPEAKKFIAQIQQLGSNYLVAHIDDIYQSFLGAIKKFAQDLSTNCQSNEAYKKRLRNILQTMRIS